MTTRNGSTVKSGALAELDAFFKIADASEPGSQGGPTSHESGKSDEKTSPTTEGYHFQEKQQGTRENVPEGVNSATPGKGDDPTSKQPQTGPAQYPTGTNPSVEEQSGGTVEDPGTSHKADTSVNGKYASLGLDALLVEHRKSAAALFSSLNDLSGIDVAGSKQASGQTMPSATPETPEQSAEAAELESEKIAEFGEFYLQKSANTGFMIADAYVLHQRAEAEKRAAAAKQAAEEESSESGEPKKPEPSSESKGSKEESESSSSGEGKSDSGSEEKSEGKSESSSGSESPSSESFSPASESSAPPADVSSDSTPPAALPDAGGAPPVPEVGGAPSAPEMGGDMPEASATLASMLEQPSPGGIDGGMGGDPMAEAGGESLDPAMLGGMEGLPEGVDPEVLAIIEALLSGQEGGVDPMAEAAGDPMAATGGDPMAEAGGDPMAAMAGEPKMASLKFRAPFKEAIEKVASFRRSKNLKPFKPKTDSQKRAYQEMANSIKEHRQRSRN